MNNNNQTTIKLNMNSSNHSSKRLKTAGPPIPLINNKSVNKARSSSANIPNATTSTKKQRVAGASGNNARATKKAPLDEKAARLALPGKKRPLGASASSETPIRVPQKRQSDGVPSISSRVFKAPVSRKPAPTGDTKAQMKELVDQNNAIDTKVLEAEAEKEVVQAEVDESKEKFAEAHEAVAALEAAIKELKEKHAKEVEGLQEEFGLKNKQVESEIERALAETAALKKEMEDEEQSVVDTLKCIEEEIVERANLDNRQAVIQESYTKADGIFTMKTIQKKDDESELKKVEGKNSDLKSKLKEDAKSIEQLDTSLFEEEMERRRNHETLQGLKGNIRVFCRIRPPLNSREESHLAQIRYFGEERESIELTQEVTSARGITSAKTHQFSFDKIFPPESSQKDCYEEISQLVQSALDGFNVCIFAYGQTGSGKTFTMHGPNEPEEESAGMIPRAVRQIYDVAQKLKKYGWSYKIEGEFLEIYNDSIIDLLRSPRSNRPAKHEIIHNHGTTVTNMTTVVLDSPEKVETLLKRAMANRTTGATKMNERSSRSHSVFTLKLSGSNHTTGDATAGRLNLVDLAGSERLGTSGSTGDRQTEAIHINKSLSCLQNVIHTLATNKKNSYIPYRNSKLTYLLQKSLGRGCKTLMFVNVSPLDTHLNESICSLRFAKETNTTKFERAMKNKVPH